MKLQVKLKQLLKDRDITQKELAERTGLKPSVISELANNQRSSINRNYIELVAKELGVKDIGEIIELTEENKET